MTEHSPVISDEEIETNIRKDYKDFRVKVKEAQRDASDKFKDAQCEARIFELTKDENGNDCRDLCQKCKEALIAEAVREEKWRILSILSRNKKEILSSFGIPSHVSQIRLAVDIRDWQALIKEG